MILFRSRFFFGLAVIFFLFLSLRAQSLEIEDATNQKNLVGINYSTWHSLAFRKNIPIRNIQEILSGGGQFGPRASWHFWAEPAVGYYRGDNAMVMDYHFELFEEAKIDFQYKSSP